MTAPLSDADALQALLDHLRQFPTAVIAFSGGVDSSLLLKVAVDALGSRATAMIALSPSLPQREQQDAITLAAEIGAELICVPTRETADPAYQANAPNRCFHCKDHVYRTLLAETKTRFPTAVLLDGMNADDSLDIRPGRAAAIKHGVRSPLHELGIAKPQVRSLARLLGLRVWDKPAAACLSSRIAYGVPVTHELLQRIETAEDWLHHCGLRQVRVRHHGDIARIEVPTEDFAHLLTQHDAVERTLRNLGWHYVTVDLAGLQHGSLNRPLLASP